MKNQFVPYELAVKIKELGFDEKCFSVYDTMGFHQDEREMNLLLLDYIKAPLWQQAFDWFMDKDLFSYIRVFNKNDYGFSVLKVGNSIDSKELLYSSNYFKSYEEARYACIEKLIELATKKKL